MDLVRTSMGARCANATQAAHTTTHAIRYRDSAHVDETSESDSATKSTPATSMSTWITTRTKQSMHELSVICL